MDFDMGVRGASLADDAWQHAIRTQIHDRKVLPVVSNRLHNDCLFGGHARLIGSYAKYVQYPFESRNQIAAVSQYDTVMRKQKVKGADRLVKREYLDFVKKFLIRLTESKDAAGMMQDLVAQAKSQSESCSVSDLACNYLGQPSFSAPDQDPLLILANFDLPVYMTTSFHEFLEQALRTAGKEPHTAMCRWNDRIAPSPEDIDHDIFAEDCQPSPMQPLVYHLHGLDRYPESLVLTEDDSFSFLVNVSRNRDRIAKCMEVPLNNFSLMLFGYDLGDWDFRTLLHGLIKERAFPSQSVCVLQLEPSEKERVYLDCYLEEVAFKVFWGSFAEYLRQLHREVKEGGK